MVLKVQEARFRTFGQRTGRSAFGQLYVVMNLHAIMQHGDAGVGDLFAVLKLRRREFDIVSLPGQWRQREREWGQVFAWT